MKKFLPAVFFLLTGSLLAQQIITPAQYDQMKSSGQLDPQGQYIFVSPDRQSHTSAPSRYSGPVQTLSNTCSCLIPLDTTFSIVPFSASLGPPEFRNDDGFSNQIALPFTFNFFGTNYDSLYINNNGNISFTTPYAIFTANPFPDSTFNMIAPFWADVDTRNNLSGLVYYKITPTHMIVKWDSVGYYSQHTDKLNTFQLIITDGQDTILPPGTNVAFCYGDMQWTTGDASQGMNGFGGIPSTTGVNVGNGTQFFQVTQSDSAGMAFDGPYANADGVDWLDDLEIYFNTMTISNVPPLVMNNTICDTIDVYTGDTLRSIDVDSIAFQFRFLTPETNQVMMVSFSTNAPATAFTATQSANTGNYQLYDCVFRAKDLPPGTYSVTGTATDDGWPAATASSTVVIRTHYDAALDGINDPLPGTGTVALYPNPADASVTVNTASASQIILTNMLGQVMYSRNVNSSAMQIDLSGFAPGTYMVTLLNNDGTRSQARLAHQ